MWQEHPRRANSRRARGQWRSLDRTATRQAANFDPTEFVAHEDLLVVDEVQRVPELLLAIKDSVDDDPRPGRFLLTGSAHVLSMRAVPDALSGRMETVELWPLSQREIDDKPDRFVDAAFALGPDLQHDSGRRGLTTLTELYAADSRLPWHARALGESGSCRRCVR